MKTFLLSTSLAVAVVLAIATASADPNDPDVEADNGPELRAVSVVHGMTFTLSQREVVPGTQGPSTMVTRVHSAVPPGPPNSNPFAIDLTIKVIAPDMEVAHAAGALTALGLMQGLTVQQISDTFAQLNWSVQIKAVSGQVDPNARIDAIKAGALAQLLISAIIAGDRPGGGCDAAIPFIRQGAAALGFPTTCQN